jgi:hypothetical protein
MHLFPRVAVKNQRSAIGFYVDGQDAVGEGQAEADLPGLAAREADRENFVGMRGNHRALKVGAAAREFYARDCFIEIERSLVGRGIGWVIEDKLKFGQR